MKAIATGQEFDDQSSLEDADQLNIKMTLGARLLLAGLITQDQLDLALREQKRSNKLIGEVLIDLGFVSPEVITETIAEEANSKVVDVEQVVIDEDVLKLVSHATAKRFKIIPISVSDSVLTVAFADAFNVVAIDYLERETKHTINVVSAPEGDILEAVARHYARGRSIADTVDLIMTDGNLPTEEQTDGESPLVRLVDQVIALGVKKGATDIHIEPDERIVKIRMRIDGVLRQEVLIPKAIQPALTARIKLMANLNITEKRVPQDGRIRFMFGQSNVDLRVSTLPTNCGESLVLRILDKSGVGLELAQLGFSEKDHNHIGDLVDLPYGMILVTGPTGSGKTTTLYTSLGLVDSNDRSVFTLEDPIEYQLSKIRQTQIKPEVGMDFSAGLRALLRQDPDVILIGEIRDLETAQLAARAALTGHLVLSTLHTNDAIGVIPRLIDMGVDRYMLPPALSAIVAQRLVRRICENCKQEEQDSEKLIDQLALSDSFTNEKVTLYRGEGCDDCNGTGYQGRQVIYEILNVDEKFHGPIIQGASGSELKELALASGMTTMLDDGLNKVKQGSTTLEEIMRVVR